MSKGLVATLQGEREGNLKMLWVAVVDSAGKPLMPCHPARARELVQKGKAIRRFDRGLFYIRLVDREFGNVQSIAVGIDPGSKKEAFTVKGESHTYLNIQTDAVTWVKEAEFISTQMRRTRRSRKTPYRKNRSNKNRNSNHLSPSTRARWGWKLRICIWLSRYYPIDVFVVEDIKAVTKIGQRRWNQSFSPLEVGKHWFYEELSKLASVSIKQGYETKAERDRMQLKKSKQKLSDNFEAHCIDSWVLANTWVGGHTSPDNFSMLYITPLRFHRRQLHRLQPSKRGIRSHYGGTLSLGFKRGSWIKHLKYGICYIGGNSKGMVSLHSLQNGKRLTQKANPEDCRFLTTASWRVRWY